MNASHYDPAKLIQARELRGETQQQIAAALNVDRQTIYRAERGQSISYDLLFKLCGHYSIPMANILRPAPVLATV